MTRELWRDVVGFEGFYQVSNMGRVRSLKRTFVRSDGSTATYKGKILKPVGNPYLHVHLSRNNKFVQARVHRLVAQTFVPNPDNLTDVDHINNIKTDNRASNLRWCTHTENMHYAWNNGRVNLKPYEDYSDDAKENMVKDKRRAVLRSDGAIFPSITSAAKALGVSRPAVGHVLTGIVETCKGYTFRYLDS